MGKQMNFIQYLDQLSKHDIKIAGGKGANLGELKTSKFQVPDGFVITTPAYSKFIGENRANLKIEELAKPNLKNKKIDKLATGIRKSITSAKIPDDIKKNIITAYRKLRCSSVAVRSSATAEDLKSASFAGQQSTFLNIKNEKALLSAVKKCWASLFNTHAIYYRNSKRVSQASSSIAVVVQKMIDSRKAGVIFTINPITMNKNEIVIEAAFGQGELVVNGSITPDMYTVDKRSNRISKIIVKHKNFGLYLGESGTVKKKLDKGIAERQVLSKKEIINLARIARKIENHYGFPQDIEWTIADKIYILQARPVTTVGS